jgi:hypothetical protein
MTGASMAPPDPRLAISTMLLPERMPVLGLMEINLRPFPNEPNDSHHLPSASTIKLGSMALYALFAVVSITTPRFVHDPAAPVVLVAKKIADLRDPKVEAE